MSIRYLKQFPTEHNEKVRFSQIAINEVLNGEVSPLEAIAVLKHLEDSIAMIKENKEFIDLLYSEVSKYPKGDTPTSLGYQISFGERRKYDFSKTNDLYMQELEKEQKEINKKLKQRQEFVTKLNQPIVDAENGGFEILPPIVTYTTYPILKEVKQGITMPESDGLAF